MKTRIFIGALLVISLPGIIFLPQAKSEEPPEPKSYYTKAKEYSTAVKAFLAYSKETGYMPSKEDMKKVTDIVKKVQEHCPAITSRKCVIASLSLGLGLPLTSYIMECKDEAKVCLDKFVEEEGEDNG